MAELLTTYSMKSLSEFYDHILPEIPGFVLGIVEQQMRFVAREFCSRTRAWHVTIDTLTIEAGIPEIELDVPDHSQVYEVHVARVNGKPIDPATEQDLKAENPEWHTRDGAVTDYLFYDPNVIRLVPIPNETIQGGLSLEASLRPTPTAAKLPSFLLDRYIETYAAGVKRNLMRMSKKPWSDPERAADLAMEFEAGVGNLGWRKAKGHSRAPLRVRTVHK